MRQLYSASTYYQLITAIQVRTKIFPDAEADLVFTDHSVGYEDVAARLDKLHVFHHVYTARVANILSTDTFKKRIDRVVKIAINDNSIVRKYSNIENLDYDEFLFFNRHYFNLCLYYCLKDRNPSLICRRYEEGYTSGFEPDIFFTRSARLQEKTRGLHHNPSIMDIETMYFFEPDLVLFRNDCEIKPIPKLDRDDARCQEIISGLFGEFDANEYDRKYIFFEESYSRDGIPMDDLELVQDIADTVGRENLMVKLHPRTQKDRFAPLGIKTNKTVGIPWEAVLMSRDFRENVFLAIASGSVLTPRILFGDNVQTYMLFNCTKAKSQLVTEKFHQYLDKFKEKYGRSGFYIPQNRDELLKLLRKENGK